MSTSILDPIFSPLLEIPLVLSICLIALLVSVIVTFVYKFTTNQSLMKDLRNELKEFQNEMKELKNHPEKAMVVQKKAMETNMKYMMQSFRSTIFTLLPVILIFGWLNANLAYEPITPGIDFTITAMAGRGAESIELIVPPGIKLDGNNTKKVVDGKATWLLNGEAGKYNLDFESGSQTFSKELLITKEQAYSQVMNKYSGNIAQITINNDPKRVLPVSLLGYKGGWLGTYVIFSMIFSSLLRKWLKVY